MAQIEFREVTKRFDNGTEALRSVSVSFEEGSMTFLTGHSGAGKSTFLRLLLRLDAPTRGQIFVNGVNIAQLPDRRIPAYRQNIGAVFQDHHLFAHHSVYDNVALPLRVGGMHERDVVRRARAALSRVGLLEKERMLPPHLSTGEQQTSRHRARAGESSAPAARGRTHRQPRSRTVARHHAAVRAVPGGRYNRDHRES